MWKKYTASFFLFVFVWALFVWYMCVLVSPWTERAAASVFLYCFQLYFLRQELLLSLDSSVGYTGGQEALGIL